jgi:sulfite exporter TauE/SafE/copper chaperone CopZ
MKEKTIYISGMTCTGCEKILERALEEKVEEIKANYETGKIKVKFDENKISIEKIFDIIQEKGYIPSLSKPKKNKLYLSLAAGLAFLLFGAYLIVKNTVGFDFFPDLTKEASFAVLFFLGLLTGFHCIGMCGGFVVSYATKSKHKWKSHFEYGAGKTIGYAAIGGLFGLFGSFIAFTPQLRGYAAIFAGLFLIIFGLNMLNIFPWLKKIRIKSPKFLNKYVAESHKSKNPFKIGLLNSLLIACGPLQAMYIYAAGTGDMITGALSLAAFGLGTLPVLIGFGFVTSLISASSTKKILKISAVVVIILGAVMMNRGVALTGTGYDANSLISGAATSDISSNEIAVLKNGYQEIKMDVLYSGWSPDKFVLQKGVPVKWIVNGIEISGCNNAIQVPKYNLEFDITPGEKVIEFTPTESGTVAWSCWMGMIPGTFIVVDDISDFDQNEVKDIQTPSGGSCGGGCGCGGRR